MIIIHPSSWFSILTLALSLLSGCGQRTANDRDVLMHHAHTLVGVITNEQVELPVAEFKEVRAGSATFVIISIQNNGAKMIHHSVYERVDQGYRFSGLFFAGALLIERIESGIKASEITGFDDPIIYDYVEGRFRHNGNIVMSDGS